MRECLVVWATLAGCTTAASIDGTATIAVIDIRGQSAAGIELVSSVDGTVLATTTTDATGTASIGVARNGEVTAYVAPGEVATVRAASTVRMRSIVRDCERVRAEGQDPEGG